jgi:hypothetical protein
MHLERFESILVTASLKVGTVLRTVITFFSITTVSAARLLRVEIVVAESSIGLKAIFVALFGLCY